MRWLPMLLMVACSSEDALNGAANRDTAEDFDSVQATLRIDVFPPQELVDTGDDPLALPQTGVAPIDGPTEIDITLQAPVRMSGQVTGWEVTPWLTPAELPGSEEPVEATLSLRRPDSLQSYTVRTVEARPGFFDFFAVPGDGYLLDVVPDVGEIPFLSQAAVSIDADVGLQPSLGAGTALYGTVTDASGNPIQGLTVWAQSDAGTTGGHTVTDDLGYYALRVQEDDTYQVFVEGLLDGRDPTLHSQPVEVDLAGARVDLSFAAPDRVLVSGQARDDGGTPIADVRVRLTSQSLSSYTDDEATLVVETETTPQGTFDIQVIAGVYDIEFLPASGDQITPVRLTDVDLADETDLEQILPVFIPFTGEVRDPQLATVGNARISCIEAAFEGRTWSTLTDDAGRYTLDLPVTPVQCQVSPPAQRSDLARSRFDVDPSRETSRNLPLEPGLPVTGTVALDDGSPVAFALVELRDGSEVVAAGFTDGDGGFQIRVDLDANRD